MTYIGPYVRCENPEEEKIAEVRACGNIGCRRYAVTRNVSWAQRFCPECGEAITDNVKVPSDAPRVNTYDIAIEFDEDGEPFYQPGTSYGLYPFEDGVDFWIPNHDFGVFTAHYDSREGGLTNISNVDTGQQMETFIVAAQKHLKTFERHYGAGSIQVRWGVISYAC